METHFRLMNFFGGVMPRLLSTSGIRDFSDTFAHSPRVSFPPTFFARAWMVLAGDISDKGFSVHIVTLLMSGL